MQADDFFAAVEDRQERELRPLFPRAIREGRPVTQASRFECGHPGCGRDFATANALAIHRGKAHGAKLPKKPELPMGGVGVSERHEHCDDVERCGITGFTECGADPCELVAEWLETRCDERTPADCQNDRCHDCQVYPVQPEAVSDGNVTVTLTNALTPPHPDYRLEAIRAWATAVQVSLMASGDDFSAEVAQLSRIIELAGF
jgi:hypothetical protein